MNPEDITTEFLDELSEAINWTELRYLQYKKNAQYLQSERERIRDQVYSKEEILSQYTVNQFVEQTIEIMSGLNVSLRTIIPQCTDHAMNFARRHSDTQEQYTRILTRMRLAHSLMEINDKMFGEPAPQGSYFDVYMADPEDFVESLNKRAEKNYKLLSIHGLCDKISEAFGVWESLVWDRLNGIDSDTLGNSTRTPEKEQ